MVKRALLIGINYYGTQFQLDGCINDVHNMKVYLDKQGYTVYRVLTDAPGTPAEEMPTRAAILAGIDWLLDGATAADHLFMHYSGHGTQTIDTNHDETDGMDEAICPRDWQTAGLLCDDDLREKLVNKSGEAQVVFVSDCCHSGTILDMRYNFTQLHKNSLLIREDEQYTPRENLVVCISGCKDKQTSADTVAYNPQMQRRQAQGALSWVLLEVLNENPAISFKDLMCDVWGRLRLRGYAQVPQLSCCRLLDLKSPIQL